MLASAHPLGPALLVLALLSQRWSTEATATQPSAKATAVCQPGMNNLAADLNGGPTNMEEASAASCRALCEDHELCGAFVMVSRVHVRSAAAGPQHTSCCQLPSDGEL